MLKLAKITIGEEYDEEVSILGVIIPGSVRLGRLENAGEAKGLSCSCICPEARSKRRSADCKSSSTARRGVR